MVGIQTISNGPQPLRPSKATDTAPASGSALTVPTDAVNFSDDSAKAADLLQVLSQAASNSEVRQERVEKARVRLEEGTHQVQEVVLQVASKLSRFIE